MRTSHAFLRCTWSKKSQRIVQWIAEETGTIVSKGNSRHLSALKAELEVIWDCLKEEMEGKEINTRMVADFVVQSHLKMWLFSLVARVYRLLLTAPSLVCKSERFFSKLKILKKILQKQGRGRTIWRFSHVKKMWWTD